MEDRKVGLQWVSSGHIHSYLVPCKLRWELPEEQIILVQAETFVDQSILRGGAGGER